MSSLLQKAKSAILAGLSYPPIKSGVIQSLFLFRRLQKQLRSRHVVVYYYAAAPFQRKAHAIADLIARRGFKTVIRSGLSHRTRVALKSSPDLWIGFWNHVPVSLLPKTYIAINAEPVTMRTDTLDHNQLWAVIKNAREVWDYSRTHVDLIQGFGVTARFVPFGYAPYYETSYQQHTIGKSLDQDIDVLFYGTMSARRQRILNEVRQQGLDVFTLDPYNPTYGEKLDELLARSKIVLNLHFYEQPEAQIPDFARIDHLLSNQIFVIHETPGRNPFDPNFENNVTNYRADEIAQACAYFASREDERRDRSEKAYEWFKTNYTLDKFIPYDHVREFLTQ